MPEAAEGDLTRAYHQLVNYQACAVVARAVGLGEALRLGGGAAKLGMRESHFNNPNGLPDESQVTSARDMAMLW